MKESLNNKLANYKRKLGEKMQPPMSSNEIYDIYNPNTFANKIKRIPLIKPAP